MYIYIIPTVEFSSRRTICTTPHSFSFSRAVDFVVIGKKALMGFQPQVWRRENKQNGESICIILSLIAFTSCKTSSALSAY
jgi:hypothetical protein